MATTAFPVHFLLAGARDSTGAPVSSGQAYFYALGTLTPATVYSDVAAGSPITQPVALDAGGRAIVFSLVPLRCRVYDSTGTILQRDVDAVNIIRAADVFITNANVNNGNETTLDAYLTSITTSAVTYKESSGATARPISAWLQETQVSVTDFNADPTGVIDATAAIQAAMDHCGATGKRLFFPAGTYAISSPVNATNGAKKFDIFGAGPKASIISQSSTTANALTFIFGGNTDYECEVRDLGVAAATVSSGIGVYATNASNVSCRRVDVSGFHDGIYHNANCTGGRVTDCRVLSTDGVSGAIGVQLNQDGVMTGGIVAGSSTQGSGIFCNGADGRVSNVNVTTGWLTGIVANVAGCKISSNEVTLTGSNVIGISVAAGSASVYGNRTTMSGSNTNGINIGSSSTQSIIANNTVTGTASAPGVAVLGASTMLSGNSVTACNSGISLAAANCIATGNVCSSNTTNGILLTAVAGCVITDNVCQSNGTTDISIVAGATGYVEFGNAYGTFADASVLSSIGLASRPIGGTVNRSVNTASATPTFTPATFLGGYPVNVFRNAYVTGAATLTVNLTASSTLRSGDIMNIALYNATVSGGTLTPTFVNAYKFDDGTTAVGSTSAIPTGGSQNFRFRYDTVVGFWRLLDFSSASSVAGSGNT